MLAQNFKTAADLGIGEVEVDALIKVLGMLERKEIENFSMRRVFYYCGTPACICGWANHVSDNRAFPTMFGGEPDWSRLPQAATDLFGYASHLIEDYDPTIATPEQAAIALRSYLSTGAANWAEALR